MATLSPLGNWRTAEPLSPPEAMTLNGDGKGGIKVKLIGKVKTRYRRP